MPGNTRIAVRRGRPAPGNGVPVPGRVRAVPHREALAFGRTVLIAGVAGIAAYFAMRAAGGLRDAGR